MSGPVLGRVALRSHKVDNGEKILDIKQIIMKKAKSMSHRKYEAPLCWW